MIDINVFMMNMPPGVNEAVTDNEDGSYSIFINDSLSPVGRLASYRHALRHIRDSDFAKNSVQDIESIAHEYSI